MARHPAAGLRPGAARARLAYRLFGADTPGESLVDAAADLDPALVVVSAVLRARFRQAGGELTALARTRPVAIAGRGATAALAESLGCHLFATDPVSAADAASELVAPVRAR